MSKITVVDAICGKGKSSWAIQYMNEMVDLNFIYITPFDREVKRVMDECSNRYFETPKVEYDRDTQKSNKYNNLIHLIEEGTNIASTHALFKQSNERILNGLKKNNYTLILDEVLDVVEQIDIKSDDIQMLIDTDKIVIESDGRIKWINESYDGEFGKHKQAMMNGDCYYHDKSVILWTFPVKIFECFKEVYILTYLFNGQLQRYYYNLNNIEYKYATVIKNEDRYELTYEYIVEDMSKFRELIHVYEGKLNDIGKSKDKRGQPLSKTWYNSKPTERCNIIKNNMYNYFQHITNAKSDKIIWTTFDKYKAKCKGKGYAKGYIPCTCRATNDYQDRNVLAYCINRFSNPMILNFFKSYGVELDDYTFATSELVQWIFRSSLRKGEEIWIYIPSLRMRNILYSFIEDYDKIE